MPGALHRRALPLWRCVYQAHDFLAQREARALQRYAAFLAASESVEVVTFPEAKRA